jgi:hypothetical protein
MSKLHYRGMIQDTKISRCTDDELDTLIGIFEESIEKMLVTGLTKAEFEAGDFTLTLVHETLNKKDHWKGTFTGSTKLLKVMAYFEQD